MVHLLDSVTLNDYILLVTTPLSAAQAIFQITNISSIFWIRSCMCHEEEWRFEMKHIHYIIGSRNTVMMTVMYSAHPTFTNICGESCTIDDPSLILFGMHLLLVVWIRVNGRLIWYMSLGSMLIDLISFLGYVDLRGTTYQTTTIATGFGAHLAQPILRKRVEGREVDLTEEEAIEIINDCMKVLFYRDARSMNKASGIDFLWNQCWLYHLYQ